MMCHRKCAPRAHSFAGAAAVAAGSSSVAGAAAVSCRRVYSSSTSRPNGTPGSAAIVSTCPTTRSFGWAACVQMWENGSEEHLGWDFGGDCSAAPARTAARLPPAAAAAPHWLGAAAAGRAGAPALCGSRGVGWRPRSAGGRPPPAAAPPAAAGPGRGLGAGSRRPRANSCPTRQECRHAGGEAVGRTDVGDYMRSAE